METGASVHRFPAGSEAGDQDPELTRPCSAPRSAPCSGLPRPPSHPRQQGLCPSGGGPVPPRPSPCHGPVPLRLRLWPRPRRSLPAPRGPTYSAAGTHTAGAGKLVTAAAARPRLPASLLPPCLEVSFLGTRLPTSRPILPSAVSVSTTIWETRKWPPRSVLGLRLASEVPSLFLLPSVLPAQTPGRRPPPPAPVPARASGRVAPAPRRPSAAGGRPLDPIPPAAPVWLSRLRGGKGGGERNWVPAGTGTGGRCGGFVACITRFGKGCKERGRVEAAGARAGLHQGSLPGTCAQGRTPSLGAGICSLGEGECLRPESEDTAVGGRFGTAQRAEDLLAAVVFAGFSTQNVKI